MKIPHFIFKPTQSLIGRFAIASLIILPIFIALSGTLFLNAFQHSQLKAEEEQLQAQLYLLISNTDIVKRNVILPDVITEPRFNQQSSGLYGFIYDVQGNEIWRSASSILLDDNLYSIGNQFAPDNTVFTEATSTFGETLNLFSYDLEWVNEDNSTLKLRYIIASDNAPLQAELNSYKKRTWQWLGAMALLLIIAQLVIMRWGLKPLRRLSRQLNELQQNEIQRLGDNYPSEILPTINNFNGILEHEKQQRERYRNTMTDLAHSLKTPLAVIQSELGKRHEGDNLISEQVQRINQIVEHQLKRAVIKVNQQSLLQRAQGIALHALFERLTTILNKVYDGNIQFHNHVNNNIVYWGEESDMLEIFGNLLDNACKYGKGEVMIQVTSTQPMLSIIISDNGQGVAENQQQQILKRGARADTVQTGQGIGLAVAIDIIASYGGDLQVKNHLGAPHLSGACFCINLPNKTS